MNLLLNKIGIRDESFDLTSVRKLVEEQVLERPIDGNHGEIHPKGEDFVSEGVPFVMATDVDNGQVDYSSCSFITAKQADSLRKGFARNGDVLLTHKATIGRTAIVRYDKHPYIMLTPQVTYYRVKDDDQLNNRYLRYYFDSQFFQRTLHLWADSGSTRAYLGITEQQKLPVIVPPITKQRKIAATLSAYDELIKNNKRRIALLEKLAEEMYREWFIRLRFPGHEKVKLIKGIPETWKVKRFSNIADFTMGQSPPSESYNESGEGLPFNQGVGTYGNRFPQKVTFCDGNGRKARKGDILFSVRAPVGRINIADCEMIIGRGLAAMRHKEGHNSYLLYLLRVAFANEDIIGNGSIFNSVGKDELARFPVLDPGDKLVEQFQMKAAHIDEQIELLTKSVELLAKTRDLLLRRLISGKLSVENLGIQFPPGMAEELKDAPAATVHA